MRVTSASFKPSTISRFIVLEGVNGAGKTTLQARMAEFLKAHAQKVVTTREPGSTNLGRTLRTLVLEREGEPPTEMAELFLFAADRAQHVARVIRPAIEAGSWVISDRYFYSTAAFQGYGRGIDHKVINKVNTLAVSGTYPDLVILLDLDPEAGLKRTRSREAQGAKAGVDSFESETLAFHKRIREGFLRIADESPQPFLILDASLPPEEISAQVTPILDWLLKNAKATHE